MSASFHHVRTSHLGDRYMPIIHPENFHQTFLSPEDRDPLQDALEKTNACSNVLCYNHHPQTAPSFNEEVSRSKPIERFTFSANLIEKVTDASDDFYTQPISQNGQILAYCSKKGIEILKIDSDEIASVHGFDAGPEEIVQSVCLVSPSTVAAAIKSNDSSFQVTLPVIDFLKKSCIFKASVPCSRIGAISSSPADTNTFASGDSTGTIRLWDIRSSDAIATATVSDNTEVCGLQISPSGSCLILGTNSNFVYLLDLRNLSAPLLQSNIHKAAVKAMSWVNQNHFITGGGMADQKMYLWSSALKKPVNEKHLDSQITGIKVVEGNIFVSFGQFLQSFIFNPHKFAYPIKEELSLISNNKNRFIGLAVFKSGLSQTRYKVVGYECSSSSKDGAIHYWDFYKNN